MKTILTIFIFLTVAFIRAQVVKGYILDVKTKKPLEFTEVFAKGKDTLYGTKADSKGKFVIELNNAHTLSFFSFGYGNHKIIKIPSDTDSLDIGKIYLIHSGTTGHNLVEKKRFLSKKKKLVCEYFDNRRKITEDELTIKCPNGEPLYKWQLKNNGTCEIEFKRLKNCSQQ